MPISLLFEISESEIVKFAEFIRTFREIIVYKNTIIVASLTGLDGFRRHKYYINQRSQSTAPKVFQRYYTK